MDFLRMYLSLPFLLFTACGMLIASSTNLCADDQVRTLVRRYPCISTIGTAVRHRIAHTNHLGFADQRPAGKGENASYSTHMFLARFVPSNTHIPSLGPAARHRVRRSRCHSFALVCCRRALLQERRILAPLRLHRYLLCQRLQATHQLANSYKCFG